MTQCTRISAVFIILFASLLFQSGNAQNDTSLIRIVRNDTITLGKYYSIIDKEGGEVIGKIISADTSSILITFGDETEVIEFSSIASIRKSISKNWSKSEHLDKGVRKQSTVFGVGISFPMDEEYNFSKKFAKGFDVMAGYTFILGKYTGFRSEIDFHHMNRFEYIAENDIEKGGHLNCISARTSFILGDLYPSDIGFHFLGGIGIGIWFRSERNVDNSYLYNGTLVTNHYSYRSESGILLSGTFGFNLSFKASPKVGIFIEPQLNYVITSGVPNYYAIKAGIIL